MKQVSLYVLFFVVVLVGLFMFKIEVSPSADTRIILENTYQTFISPPCYEQAQKTNNLTESDIKQANALNYQPESTCTESSLTPVKLPITYAIAEKLGIKESKWEW
ncbi:hypothetical protein [Brevibacillus sp. NRS-1366]|uniref:hypothetical protein n=1 Tax=Brevibacillus sp. NRS-1366 TaxID=3233899 RepID=UPI003D1C6ABD